VIAPTPTIEASRSASSFALNTTLELKKSSGSEGKQEENSGSNDIGFLIAAIILMVVLSVLFTILLMSEKREKEKQLAKEVAKEVAKEEKKKQTAKVVPVSHPE
jgi:mannitol-specific phosphotransferase system IIBC component